MKRWPLVLVMAVLLIAARSERAVTLQSGDTAHCNADALVLTSAVDARCMAFTATPTATAVAVPTATATSTSTPAPVATATDTPSPVATATATATATPSAGLALCPSHDATAWHALIDAARACHYDHEHGDNPALGDSVFGPVAWQTISYPWATSAMENTHKHGGYKYVVLLNQPCMAGASYEGQPNVNCVRDARIEYHTVAASLDGLARYHSYYIEYNICAQPTFTQCGVLRIGGWADFGVLNAPYAGARVYRPGGTLDFGLGSTYGGANSEIIMSLAADTPDLDQIASVGALPCCDEPYVSLEDFSRITLPGFSPQQVWAMNNVGINNHFGVNQYARFSERIFDPWDSVDRNDPNAQHYFCRDGSCDRNGSLREISETSAWIPSAWDTGNTGFADASGFTNRFGQVVTGCIAIGLDCVPFSATHVPVGYADTRDGGCECNRPVEYDVSPLGSHWIEFPN